MKTVKSRLRDKKGFTLVEIIVVLVIIAILAAAAVPTMIGYVEDARGKAFAAEARIGFVAAQAAIMEILAAEGKVETSSGSDCGIVDGAGAELTEHDTFKALTDGITSTAVFTGMTLVTTSNELDSMVFHSKGLTDYPHYDITVERGEAIEVKRITADDAIHS